MVVVATSPVPQLANDIETLLCNHHVMQCDEYVITSHRALALCLARSVSLSLSPSLFLSPVLPFQHCPVRARGTQHVR